MKLRLMFLLLGLVPATARTEITLAPIFADHAVLQRDKPLPIWGRAIPGEKIAVAFRDRTVTATTAKDGRWIVYLDPLAASTEPADLVVTGKETIRVRDVVIGEVWLASGQSNMEWPVSRVDPEEQKIAAAPLPLVRHLKIERAVAGEPADTVKTGGWQPASPETVGGFSAVAYFFAREIHRKTGLPVGIVNSSWGGTEIESWMSDAARRDTPVAAAIDARWQESLRQWTPERIARYPDDMAAWQQAQAHAKATNTKNPLRWPRPPATAQSPGRPGGLFNAMIAPLQPMALRGILWYQGESNASRPDDYESLFPAMIRAWRGNWGDDALPFYFVQLPNYANDYPDDREWARMREAQTRALALPATGMAVAIDLGDPGDVHPTKKLEVGRRLALIAKAQVHDIPGDPTGPVFKKAIREGSRLRVTFDHAAGGLVAHLKPPQSLELAGADRIFHPADGKIERDTLMVSSVHVKEPVAVRYAWTNAPVANLFNGAGLPVAPFRSDNWPVPVRPRVSEE